MLSLIYYSDKKVLSIHVLYAEFKTIKLKNILSSLKEKGFNVTATLFELLIMTITNQSVRMYVSGKSSDADYFGVYHPTHFGVKCASDFGAKCATHSGANHAIFFAEKVRKEKKNGFLSEQHT